MTSFTITYVENFFTEYTFTNLENGSITLDKLQQLISEHINVGIPDQEIFKVSETKITPIQTNSDMPGWKETEFILLNKQIISEAKLKDL